MRDSTIRIILAYATTITVGLALGGLSLVAARTLGLLVRHLTVRW